MERITARFTKQSFIIPPYDCKTIVTLKFDEYVKIKY